MEGSTLQYSRGCLEHISWPGSGLGADSIGNILRRPDLAAGMVEEVKSMGLTQDTRLKLMLQELPADKLDNQEMRVLEWLSSWSDETVGLLCGIFRKCREGR